MRTTWIAALAVVAAVCVGCEKKTAPEAKPAPEKAPAPPAPKPTAPEEIVIGEIGSLTGAEAAFGISTRNGIELALEEANAEGGVKGKKVRVIVYDDQSKPEEAASAATRLITQDKVVLLLGEVASSNSL